MKNEIESNYILKSKIHFRFLISSVNKFTITVALQKSDCAVQKSERD